MEEIHVTTEPSGGGIITVRLTPAEHALVREASFRDQTSMNLWCAKRLVVLARATSEYTKYFQEPPLRRPPMFAHVRGVGRRACPNCRRVLDGVTGVPVDETLARGDAIKVVCVYCGVILQIEHDLLRPATHLEWAPVDEAQKKAVEDLVGKPAWIKPGAER